MKYCPNCGNRLFDQGINRTLYCGACEKFFEAPRPRAISAPRLVPILAYVHYADSSMVMPVDHYLQDRVAHEGSDGFVAGFFEAQYNPPTELDFSATYYHVETRDCIWFDAISGVWRWRGSHDAYHTDGNILDKVMAGELIKEGTHASSSFTV